MSIKTHGGLVPTFQPVDVTPAMAKEFLKKNNANRTVRTRTVSALASAIQRGEWKLSHQAIAFDPDGNLLDGQHRLLAIVESGRTVPCLLALNADPNTFDVLDIGVRRNNADIIGDHTRVVEVCNLIADLMEPGSDKRCSAQQVAPYHKVFGAKAHQLLDVTSRFRRVLTSTPVRAAAAIAMFEHQDYVLDIYKGFVSGEISNLPRIAQSFVIPAMSGGVKYTRFDLLVRAWSVFNPEKGALSRVHVRDRDNQLDGIREHVLAIMEKYGDAEEGVKAVAKIRELALA